MISKNNITIHVCLDFGDFLHANRLYRASTSKDYIGRPLLGFISIFLGGFYWVFLLTRPLNTQNVTDLSFVVAIVLCLIGLAFIFDLIPTILLWFTFRQNSQLYSEPYQAIFDKNGMAVQRQNASSKYEWNFYKEGVEGRDEFILIYGKGLYFAIPKISFQNEDEIDVFRNIMKSNLTIFEQKLKIPMDF